MKNFMDADFLLQTETAKTLYHEAAEHTPIFDYHNHLSPQQILDDVQMDNLTQVWLGGDHYKWRAMRAMGFSEELITGKGDDYEKYLAFAKTIENSIGNPLYHWTHLELQRYFGITTPLSEATAKEIWDEANAKLRTKEFSVRNLILGQNVSYMCTTDDPVDDLHCHIALREENFACRVMPSFRPDKAINLEKDDFADYVQKLSAAADMDIASADDMLAALAKRLDYFIAAGCVVSDHSIEGCFYVPATSAEVNAVFSKRMNGGTLTEQELGMYKGYLLVGLGRLYSERNIAMQIHIKALRNNSTRRFLALGVDTGFDSMNDFAYAPMLSALLNAMDLDDHLPKTVLYSLNPNDNPMLAAMAGNFQAEGVKAKVQFGTAWWFNDHKPGMEEQMITLSSMGLLSTFVGMLTDSRSFLSFPRHEYFRRILCNLVGNWVENGEYPAHMDYLKGMIENISFNNAVNYFLK
ncbi:MAG: glucuronate isomerase [Fusicatenibacter sp.]|nr:glucuronate isomerase [Lachnospiraceae bacterium]MDY2936851.1 glucuronate isomerase [Fusicatenibacter sp.]